MTQEELAFEAHLERGYISLMENGKKKPSLDTILKLAGALKCKAAELVADVEVVLATAPKARPPLAAPRVARRIKPQPQA